MMLRLPHMCIALTLLAPAHAMRFVARRATMPHMVAADVGEPFPPAALARLSVPNGKRSAICFVQADDGFTCAKALGSFSDRAAEFAEKSCTVFIVRPSEGVNRRTALQYPSMRFIEDVDSELAAAAGLDVGGRTDRSPRATFVLAANGTVCGMVSDRVEATAHAPFALKCLADLDAAVEAEGRASMDSLKQMVVEAAAPAAAEAEVTEQDEQKRIEREKKAALRAQSLFAEANRNAKFSFGRTTLEEEAKRLGERAAERAEKAAAEELEARAARARAEASGDERAAANCKSAAEAAMNRANEAREDEVAALRIQVEATNKTLVQIVRQLVLDEQQAKDFARRAYSQRRLATAAMVRIDEAADQAAMRAELANW